MSVRGEGCKRVFVAKMRGEGVFRKTSASFAYLAGRNLYALRVVFLLPPAQFHIHVARRRNHPRSYKSNLHCRTLYDLNKVIRTLLFMFIIKI